MPYQITNELKSFLGKSQFRIRFTEDGNISLYDVFHILGIKNNEKKLLEKYKSSTRNHSVFTCSPQKKWDPDTQEVTDINKPKETPCTDMYHTNDSWVIFYAEQTLNSSMWKVS